MQLVQLPMFLFSATFYPLSVYPVAIQWFVRVSPLYHAITLIRSFTLGTVGPINLVNAGYLVALGLFGIWLARRRMAGLLSPRKWAIVDSNHGPPPYQSGALTN